MTIIKNSMKAGIIWACIYLGFTVIGILVGLCAYHFGGVGALGVAKVVTGSWIFVILEFAARIAIFVLLYTKWRSDV